MFCTKCGQKCPDSSAFCTRCGAPLKPPQAISDAAPIPQKKAMPLWAWIMVSFAGALAACGIILYIAILADPSAPDGTHTLTIDFGALTTPAEQVEPESTTQWTESAPTIAPTFFEETVIYDDSEIKITAVELTNERNSFDLSFLVENNSSRNIAVCGDYFLINGAVIEEDVYIRAASGKKGYGTLSIRKSDLRAVGVDLVATITSGDFHITDTDSYWEICFVPFTVETSFADQYIPSESSTGKLLYENNGLKVTYLTMRRSYSGYDVYLLIQNDTAHVLTADADNLSINGYTIGTWMYDQIHPGTARVCAFLISDSDLEDSKITGIDEITFEVRFIKNLQTLYRTGELTISLS